MILNDLFEITYGQKEYHNKENLENGKHLLISSKGEDNGCYGFFDIKPKYKSPFITVPSTGSIGEAFVQIYDCSVDDNCLVLSPKERLSIEYLFFIAKKIRQQKWRFRYGRQITPNRLGRVEIISQNDFHTNIDYNKELKQNYPISKSVAKKIEFKPKFKEMCITDFFNVERGDFHAIDKLKEGKYPTVSRISSNNGIVGFYDSPKKAKIYCNGIITISTVTGDAFLQLDPFIATDNVLLLIPKKALDIFVLMFITASINASKWRYSYGRQPYKRIFEKTKIPLPVNKNGFLDVSFMKKIVENNEYWHFLKNS